MSPGKPSPGITPLGIYSHGSGFRNSHSGLQLDSNTFSSDSSIARLIMQHSFLHLVIDTVKMLKKPWILTIRMLVMKLLVQVVQLVM